MSTKDVARRVQPERSAFRTNRAVSVLVVDDEPHALTEVRKLLEVFRCTVLTAGSATEALQALVAAHTDVALVDWRLKTSDDGIALGRCLRRDYGIPFVVFSGYLNTEVTGNAYRLGAADVIDKPLQPRRLLAAIERALHQTSLTPHNSVEDSLEPGSDSISQRWTRIVRRAVRAPKDPRTETDAARAASFSTSVFRQVCRECDVPARGTRDLIRFLRALSRAREDGSTLKSHLSVYDPRTRGRLFEQAGLRVDARSVPLRAFLLGQKFVPTATVCLQELAHALANDPLFLVEPDEAEEGWRVRV
jgi:CheY-like chemotaxis protein